jgi:hypothetical protein
MVKIFVTKYKYKVFITVVWLLFIVLPFSCKEEKKDKRSIERCFYYWKSVFKITGYEQEQLNSLGVKTIYVKFFDVDWNEAANAPVPVAKLQAGNQMNYYLKIIPTVFITNECIQKIDTLQVKQLAVQINTLITGIVKANHFITEEIQIDCDWSAATRNNYFLLLKNIRQLNRLPLSATIRLHQIKFFSSTGVPPVDRGLLMCYNMGNLKNIATQNSILEVEELKKYTGNLSSYPLPLDVALPLFNWKVLFRNNVYKGLIQNLADTVFTNAFISKTGNRYELLKDTLLQGYDLKKGDIIRNEQSNYSDIIAAAQTINKRLKNTTLKLSLYHLDEVLLKKYSTNELEAIYNSMR